MPMYTSACTLTLVLQDAVRDVRGFATKFYTQEGVWDIVGNNIPVFFIQDAIKFPDFGQLPSCHMNQ